MVKIRLIDYLFFMKIRVAFVSGLPKTRSRKQEKAGALMALAFPVSVKKKPTLLGAPAFLRKTSESVGYFESRRSDRDVATSLKAVCKAAESGA